MNPVELTLFSSRIQAVCDEMGAVLRRTSFSPNIKDRLDFSCAVFDAQGHLAAQAAHIPVHLGSMAFAMKAIVSAQHWSAGAMLVLNDPYLGGTHLPDVTVVSPVFMDEGLVAFVANRAHHADIGASSPGSMPISASLDDEGLLIPPTLLMRDGRLVDEALDAIASATRSARQARGDFAAQISANQAGVKALSGLITRFGAGAFAQSLVALNDYAERLSAAVLKRIRPGRYRFDDLMDDDGQGHLDVPIKVCLSVEDGRVRVDFTGTSEQVGGNINCPLSVAVAGVWYVFRCLMPANTPACAGAFRGIDVFAPEGSLLNARRPAAVAAGNVETSTRVVDVVIGALAQALEGQMPAASHGSMNNLAMGGAMGGSVDAAGHEDRVWDYYETMGGGMGAGPDGGGLDGVQTHMTNTLNTPIEVLESLYPLRVERYGLRSGSGGDGRVPGGEGLLREFVFLAPARVTLLTERRRRGAWGIDGGSDGAVGENRLDGALLGSKVEVSVGTGQVLTVLTPGGGGWSSTDALKRRSERNG